MRTPLGEYLGFLRSAGVEFSVAPGLLRENDHRGPLQPGQANPRHLRLSGGLEVVERFDPGRGLGADHASLSVAEALAGLQPPVAGEGVVDMGCGTGVLGIVAALQGARVIGTDVDPVALELARRNAAANGVALDLRLGSLCDPLAGETVDLFLANLPQKPSCGTDFLPLSQDGGVDGDALFSAAVPEMSRLQRPGGRLLFYAHSLAHPRLLGAVGRHYELELLRWKLRWLEPGEYGPLRDRFRDRHSAGTSFLVTDGDREALVGGVWLCTRRSG
jgi:release factor glutamine methyltransferase